MYIYPHTCGCIQILAYMCEHTYAHADIYIYIYMHTHIYICTYPCGYIDVDM